MKSFVAVTDSVALTAFYPPHKDYQAEPQNTKLTRPLPKDRLNSVVIRMRVDKLFFFSRVCVRELLTTKVNTFKLRGATINIYDKSIGCGF